MKPLLSNKEANFLTDFICSYYKEINAPRVCAKLEKFTSREALYEYLEDFGDIKNPWFQLYLNALHYVV